MGLVHFEEEDIRYCLAKAVEIGECYELYVLNGKGFPRSVDDLAWICEQYLEKTIVIEEVDFPAEGSSIKAAYWAMNDETYRIGLTYGMDDDDLRFVLCKEIFHVIFDDESRRNMDLSGHVSDYGLTLRSAETENPKCAVAWETLAEIAAMEFLFPHAMRAKSLAEMNNVDYARIAALYGVPRPSLEEMCNAGNMEYLKQRMPE